MLTVCGVRSMSHLHLRGSFHRKASEGEPALLLWWFLDSRTPATSLSQYQEATCPLVDKSTTIRLLVRGSWFLHLDTRALLRYGGVTKLLWKLVIDTVAPLFGVSGSIV